MVPWREPEVSKLQNSNRQNSVDVRTIRFYTVVVDKCKSGESKRERVRERDVEGEEKRNRVREGVAGRRGGTRLRWLRLIVFAASVLSFSQYPEYATSGDHF